MTQPEQPQEIIPPGDAYDPQEAGDDLLLAKYKHHRGPLPDPETAERYELLLPGTLNRLLTMVERDMGASIDADREQRRNEFVGMMVGTITALVIVGGTLWVYLTVAMAGQDTRPLAAVIVALEALVGLVIYRRLRQALQPPEQKQ